MSRLLARAAIRDFLLGLALLCATLALLFYPKPAMDAARSGLQLCYNVIIPSLFPFFVLSSLVVELGLADYLGRLLEGIMRPLFHVGGACASAFALGFIGGYPVGAKTAISLYERGMCSRTEAERLLAFCNNSGPAFILGVVGAGIFASSAVGVTLYLAHALASVCVGLLFRFYKAGEDTGAHRSAPRFQAKRLSAAFTGSVKSAFLSTQNICAFVVFFTVVIQLLIRSGFLPGLAQAVGTLLAPFGMTPEWAQRLLTGMLEVSSGVSTLTEGATLSGRLTMAAFMLGWAGISVHCQVLSFIGDSGLSPGTYLVGKLLHGGLSALFIGTLLKLFPLTAPVSNYLADQVAGIAGMEFHGALTVSILSAWLIFVGFLLAAALGARKKPGKSRRSVL